ncbi:unnamed protein product [Linum trigynum]|uniref:Uncharacterized protein n=1 Tax=Linum trigynum TaxID=586398 RepID=A0AAV2CRS2_9ROSI
MDHDLHFNDVAIDEEKEGQWRFTGVYGWPENSVKWRTWDLRSLGGQWNGPCLYGGDFNQVLSTEEKSGGRQAHEMEMSSFGDCLTDTGCRIWVSKGTRLRGRTGEIEAGSSKNDWIDSRQMKDGDNYFLIVESFMGTGRARITGW